ncbi:hypothetical protein [Alicyclobacillus ferrooxydans]|uniref:Uncharacterized protein n=1 Tax=Alicyclobacillus ferrooxydans TaxID=471514 RepID=A0A0P9ETB5_9BACL|nr:hypothetical protein [Alicyclobacillus ferrooxydans]KPV42019.1 hypothetical protein AN477_19820 [Alicyclobacillus ferrooxydans]
MSYCTLSDVQDMLVQFTIDANSNPSDTQVTNEIIPMYDRYIDDRLGRYYQVPITGTNALVTMQQIEKRFVAAEIADRIYLGQTGSNSPQGANWRTLAEQQLTQLVQGDVILWDAQQTGETPEPEYSQVSDNLSVATRQTPPAFSMGMKF